MKKDKKRIREALLDELCELVLTLVLELAYLLLDFSA